MTFANRSSLGVLAALLVAAPAQVAAQSAPPQRAVDATRPLDQVSPPRLVRAGHATLASGRLSAPSGDTPRAIGRAFLAARPDVFAGVDPDSLALAADIDVRRGHALRYRQVHAGLEVVGAGGVVRVDDRGQVRWALSSARPSAELDRLGLGDPRLSPSDAARALAGAGAHGQALMATAAAPSAELVIYAAPAAGPPRLAYRVELPLELRRMEMLRGYVDADTGAVLAIDDRVRRQALPQCPPAERLAYVYEQNPDQTPELSCVSLAEYLPGEPPIDAPALTNADVSVQNCIDNSGCRFVEGDNHHFCDLESVAFADQAGNFTEHVFESDTAEEDGFAEVQMFYHVNKAYAVARALGGFDNLAARPLAAIVNFRAPSFDADSTCTGDSYAGTTALEVFDNALYVPSGALFGGFPEEDAIIFGQGAGADFSYDGDVVYHEFGHAVMDSVAPNLTGMFLDTLGLNTMPGGMHEGYADLMTMFVTDDPEIGEYAAISFDDESTEIRNLDNTARCPQYLTGEIHDDSLPLTGAMWEAREAVGTTPERKLAFDQAVFAAQRTFASFEDFGTAGLKTLAELETTLDAAAAATAAQIFTARGILPDDERNLAACENRVLPGSADIDVPYLYLTGTERFVGWDQVPAPVQFRYELSERAQSIEFEVGASVPGVPLFGPGQDSEADIYLVVRGGGAAVAWSYAANEATAQASRDGKLSFSAVPDSDVLQRGTVSIEGPFDPGTYHLQLANHGPTWIVAQLSVTHTPASSDGGCQAGGGSSGLGAGLLAILIAGFLTTRRRRAEGARVVRRAHSDRLSRRR
ncbi:hypothetical protein [Haliangium sp.]|uniref:hypothetical protein n=1 Tax=Haliangium sp. TaxID=2663208 RepID=UPI003D0DB7A1